MNFKDFKKLESKFSIKPLKENKSIDKDKFEDKIYNFALNDLISSEEKKKEYFKNPVEYFYQDTISETVKFDFRSALGISYYNPASDDALACLEICCFNELNPYRVHGWLVSAFKFIDHFVLHFIQDIKEETPKKIHGDEISRYIQLQGFKGQISKVGVNLIILYKLRNKQLEHRTKKFANGKQELLKPDRKKVYSRIKMMYPEALKLLLSEYKLIFPKLVLK